jgi:hypothetical protein
MPRDVLFIACWLAGQTWVATTLSLERLRD